MGKFENDESDVPKTRVVRQTKTEPVDYGNQKGSGDGVVLDREQLRAMERAKLAKQPPPTVPENKRGFGVTDPPPGYESPRSANKTVVYPKQNVSGDEEETIAPVVAWLVIVEGKGRGRAFEVSYGLNKIGRSADQEIPLNFDDEEISRKNHAAIEYDPKDRSFYLTKGENLVYVNDKRVGMNSEHKMEAGDLIQIGNSILNFVPFCHPGFDWSD